MTTVLIVDDSKTIRQTATVYLAQSGHRVETVEDGFLCLPKIMELKPDIVFMDVMMPKLDGYQACTVIKSNRKLKDISVVMLSSKDGLFDLARGRIVGVDGHLSKPFSKQALLDAIDQYAHRS